MPSVALVGDVAVELIAPYFEKAGYETVVAPGFGAWRQELLNQESPLNKADFVFEVTKYDAALEKEVEGAFDERMKVLASMPYSLKGIAALLEEFLFLRLAAPKKILALDADNTLWKGILSEDGEEKLTPYREFQEGVLKLKAKGVTLVLLTKNDPFEFRADMPLQKSDFAVARQNWAPKAGNLIEACRALNLGLDSVVFVDDNPHERAQMAAHLPEVTVVPFPEDMGNPKAFLRRLEEYFFSEMGKTDEDALRAKSYAALRKASEELAQYKDSNDYLKSLKLKVSASFAAERDLDRLAQMAGKTNQFNATTIRRTREEFAALIADPSLRVFTFRTADKFGLQGLVLYAVVDLKRKAITDFVMSCRAMGRTLEYAAMDHICRKCGFVPSIDFVKSAKNCPFEEFLARFTSCGKNGIMSQYDFVEEEKLTC